ncbi:MAG: ATP-dependent zinc metalloprotease FtsH [Candidatus Peregrinibacteria bacterium GW2011_GWA2_44_7]|nr:MAG: ATP-dependent zinc metalloprotease FtsH [Candidatus Peregrinibacteria bacterium GW2011_GWA2_44_7]
MVDLPDVKAREEILKVHSGNKPLDKNVNLEKIAKQTPGFSGADLENLMNEAAILTAKLNKKKIYMKSIENSIEKVVMGPERKSRVMSKEEKKITAYHEAGHAIAGHYSPKCDPVHKISIVSRGMSLGATWFIPEEDKHLNSRSKYMDELASLMGGYAAEELIFGEMTTGASNDLEKASNIARRMVTEFGMSALPK